MRHEPHDEARLRQQVERQAERKLHGRRARYREVWFGLSMFGLIGWTIALPAVLGTMAGAWLDRRYPLPFSWTLTGLGAGLALGCLTAWRWLVQERGRFERPPEERDRE